MRSLISILLLISVSAFSATYYVAPSGSSDSNDGSIGSPWATWQHAFATANAGDTVYFRGGIWYPQEHISGNSILMIDPVVAGIGNTGNASDPICYFNYPGETPILDCDQVDTTGNRFNDGISLRNTHFLKFKGLTIRNVYQPVSAELPIGITTDNCSNLSLERMVIYNVQGRGFHHVTQIGQDIPGEYVITYDTLRVINCDIYDCFDALTDPPGNGADGFKYGSNSGGYALFQGNRAWNCSDDGYDLGGQGTVIIENCWSFNHGFENALDGDGFKFGGPLDSVGYPIRIVRNNLAVFNWGIGFFDLEYNGYYRNESRIYNNTAYKNSYSNNLSGGFSGVPYDGNSNSPWMLSKYRNNISYDNFDVIADLGVYTWYEEHHNTWDAVANSQAPFNEYTDTVTVSDADFVLAGGSTADSITAVAQLKQPRQSDGSLPVITFMHLVEGSDLIDAGAIDVAGLYIGYPDSLAYIYDPLNVSPDHIYPAYSGLAPDIGAFEFDPNTYDKPIKSSDGKFMVSIRGNLIIRE